MSSRRKCEKRHIGFLTSIYREGISQTVRSFALQILRPELLHCFPRKTRHVPWLLRCTPCFRNGSFPSFWAGPADVGFAPESDRNSDLPGGRLVRPCCSERLLRE